MVAIMAMSFSVKTFGQAFIKTGFYSDGLSQQRIEARMGTPRLEAGYVIFKLDPEWLYTKQGVRDCDISWDKLLVSAERADKSNILSFGSELSMYAGWISRSEIKAKAGIINYNKKVYPYLYGKMTGALFMICFETEGFYTSKNNKYMLTGYGLQSPEFVYDKFSMSIKSLLRDYWKFYDEQLRIDLIQFLSTELSVDYNKKLYVSTKINWYYYTNLNFHDFEKKTSMEASIKYVF